MAGIYAFQPLDEATTVHTTIIGSQRPSLFVMLDGHQMTFNADATLDPGEMIILYDGIGNGKTATIELDTNLKELNGLNDGGGVIQTSLIFQTANAAGTWEQVTSLDSASGAEHKLLSSVHGVRLTIIPVAGTGTITFEEGAYVKLTVVGT